MRHRCALFIFVLAAPEAWASAEAPSVPGQLLVRFKDGVSQSAGNGVFALLGGTAKRVTPADPQVYLVDLPQGMDNASGLSLYQGFAEVDLVEENFLYAPVAEPDDLFYPQQWSLPQISAPAAWDITTGDRSVVIADTDTGARLDHPDLIANLWLNTGEICDNGIDDDENGYIDDCVGWNFPAQSPFPNDTNGHGSNTAGIMGAVGNNQIGVAGVMWDAQLMILKMGDGTFSTGNIVPAIDYAWQNGARIINASWGGPGRSSLIEAAIQRANDADVLFVTAAGNNGTNNDEIPFYPANYDIPSIISVANTRQDDTLYRPVTIFDPNVPSNWGPNTVHLAAPGTNILSTFYSSSRPYTAYWGTSQASPHVAGTAALIWSVNPLLSMAEVKDIILRSVDPVDALADKVITGGRLNADAAVKLALSK